MRHNGFQVLFCWPQLATFYVFLNIAQFSYSEETEKLPSLLLISFDGFRWDYLKRGSTKNFHKFIQSGVYATKGLKGVFPTVTLTDHWSIVTGLYSESHGIIDNDMYDPIINKSFVPLYKNKKVKNDKRFYDNNGVEPIWVTNSLQHPKRKSGSIMWWGAENEIKGIRPFYHMPYDDEDVDDVENIDKMVELFSSPTEAINLGLLYFSDPDETAHKYGPDSDNVTEVIENADLLLEYLLEEFDRVGLLDRINIIVTSDHGFAPVSKQRLIHLDDIVDRNWYKVVHYNPIVQIIPHDGMEEKVFQKLQAAQDDHHYKVYKKADIPERLHYKHNVRVTPIVALADLGYQFISNMSDEDFKPAGSHGWDPEYQEMNPFFMARGPAFKKNVTVETFAQVDLYPLMCHVLGLRPAPHNGSTEIVSQLLVDGIPTPGRTTSISTVSSPNLKPCLHPAQYVSSYPCLSDIRLVDTGARTWEVIHLTVVLLCLALVLVIFIWRRRRYLRYRLKQLTPESWQKGQVTIAWPVTLPKMTVTKANGPQMPLMMNYSDESDDEF